MTTLLRSGDLKHLPLALRLSQPLDTEACIDLTLLLQRTDVHLIEWHLLLSNALDTQALAELLSAADAHRASLALGGLQLQWYGEPPTEAMRLVIAGSALCLELGASTVRPGLFGHLLQHLKDAELNDGPFGLMQSLQVFLAPQPYANVVVNQDSLKNQMVRLALQVNDPALLRAVSVLSLGRQIEMTSLPEAAADQCLERLKIPYRLSIGVLSPKRAKALAQWLERPHAMLQAINLDRIHHMDQTCWASCLQGWVAQPALQTLRVHIDRKNRPPKLSLPPPPVGRRLPTLMVSTYKNHTWAERVGGAMLAQLIQWLKPEHLVLKLRDRASIVPIVVNLGKGSQDVARLLSLHIGWTAINHDLPREKDIQHVCDRLKAGGGLQLAHPQGEPTTPASWRELARNATGEILCLSLKPGPDFGLTDQKKPSSTLRFEPVWKWAYLMGAGEAVLQAQLLKHDPVGLGQPDVAKYFIQEAAFSARDLRALARVSKSAHQAGRVAAIVSALGARDLKAPALREWLTLPSGELDFDRAEAVRVKLANAGESKPTPWRLLEKAITPQSV